MEMVLKLKDISWMGQAAENHSLFSPFSYIDEEGFDEEDLKRLQELGIVSDEGAILGETRSLIEAFQAVDRYITIITKTQRHVFRKSYYYSGDQAIGMTPKQEGLSFALPGDQSAFLKLMEELTGNAKFYGTKLDLTMPLGEGAVLFAMCDLYRKAALKSMAMSLDFEGCISSVEEIKEAITNQDSSGHDLMHLNREIFASLDLESIDIVKEIDALVKKSLVLKDGDKYTLCGEAASFAGNCLMIDKRIDVSTARMDGDKVLRGGFTLWQSGANDLYITEPMPDEIHLVTVSAAIFLEDLRALITDGPQFE